MGQPPGSARVAPIFRSGQDRAWRGPADVDRYVTAGATRRSVYWTSNDLRIS